MPLPTDITRCRGMVAWTSHTFTCARRHDCLRYTDSSIGDRVLWVALMCDTEDYERQIRPGVDIDAVHRKAGG